MVKINKSGKLGAVNNQLRSLVIKSISIQKNIFSSIRILSKTPYNSLQEKQVLVKNGTPPVYRLPFLPKK